MVVLLRKISIKTKKLSFSWHLILLLCTFPVFSNYDADFIATSLDEAYVNITDICNDKSVSSEQVRFNLVVGCQVQINPFLQLLIWWLFALLTKIFFFFFYFKIFLLFEKIASELRNTIYEQTGLTCSVGVAPNRLLAKVRLIYFVYCVIPLSAGKADNLAKKHFRVVFQSNSGLNLCSNLPVLRLTNTYCTVCLCIFCS